MPRVTVLYFAVLRERKGRDREEINVPEGSTLADVLQTVLPDLASTLTVAFARNQRYAPPDEVVEEGDEIGLLPPLGGG